MPAVAALIIFVASWTYLTVHSITHPVKEKPSIVQETK